MRKRFQRYSTFRTSPRASLGSGSGAGGSAGTGERRRLLGRWGQENARSFFARGDKGAAAGGRTRPRLDQTETKRPTRAGGCRGGGGMLTRSTESAWVQGWM